MLDEEGAIIELLDENGDAFRFDHLLTFEHEGEKYIALLPIDEVEGVGEDEVMLMKLESDGEEDTYLPIEDEELLENVFQTFLEIWEELEQEEEPEEE